MVRLTDTLAAEASVATTGKSRTDVGAAFEAGTGATPPCEAAARPPLLLSRRALCQAGTSAAVGALAAGPAWGAADLFDLDDPPDDPDRPRRRKRDGDGADGGGQKGRGKGRIAQAPQAGVASWTSIPLPVVPGAVPKLLHRDQTMNYTQAQIDKRKGNSRGGGRLWDRIDIVTKDGEACLEQRFDPDDVISDRNFAVDFLDVDYTGVQAVLMRYQWMCDGYRDWIDMRKGNREGGKGFAIGGGLGYEGPHQRYSADSEVNQQKYGNDAWAVYVMHRFDGAVFLLAVDSSTPQCPKEDRDCNSSKTRFGHYPAQNARPLEKNVWHTLDVLCMRDDGYKLSVDGKLQSWCDHPLVKGELSDLHALQESDRSMSGGVSREMQFRYRVRTTEWNRRRETFLYYA